MAIASAILATTSGVRLDGRPSPCLSRLLILRLGSLSIIGGPFCSKRYHSRERSREHFQFVDLRSQTGRSRKRKSIPLRGTTRTTLITYSSTKRRHLKTVLA